MNRYPGRLHHRTPAWVKTGATYHIRISTTSTTDKPLTVAPIGTQLLNSAAFYHEQERWHCRLLLLMPDHLHALLIFPSTLAMGPIVASWKGYQAKRLGIVWQNNFFDHRIRSHDELQKSEAYIRHNPVRKGLCESADAWPWVISCAETTRPEAGFHPAPSALTSPSS